MPARSYRMKVVVKDREGRRRAPAEWVTVPNAEVVPHGFSRIRSMVEKVAQSAADSAWVTISSTSGRSGISISKHRGVLKLGINVDVSHARTRERSTRTFFSSRGLAPSEDYLGGNGGVPNAVRILGYNLPDDVHLVADIAADALRTLFRLCATSTLHLRFTERGKSSVGAAK